jgi:hypothetical protein
MVLLGRDESSLPGRLCRYWGDRAWHQIPAHGLERDLLDELYRAAVAQDPSLGPSAGSMGPGKAAVQVMLERLLRSGTFAQVAQRAFIGNLKQVTRFLTDRPAKDLILGRVHEEVDDGTRVVIGHSLGSVVAYEYRGCAARAVVRRAA